MFKSALFVVCVAVLAGCTSLKLEYEHVSHPLAGWPVEAQYGAEDTLDHIQACAVRKAGRLYSEACLGHKLRDGGMYGPSMTGAIKIGMEFAIPQRRGVSSDCHGLPGMVGDDC